MIKYYLALSFRFLYIEKHNIVLLFYKEYLWLFFTGIFFILYIYLFYLVVQHKRKMSTFQNKEASLFYLIDYRFYTKNVFFTLFRVVIYFLFTGVIYLLWRIYAINNPFDFSQKNLYEYLTLYNFLLLFLFLCFIGVFRQFVETIVYADVLRLHLYFCKYYANFILEWKAYGLYPGFILKEICYKIGYYLAYIVDESRRKEFDALIDDGSISDFPRIKKIYKYIKNYKILLNILRIFYNIITEISFKIREIIIETAWITIIIALLYDIKHLHLYYTNYAILIYIIRMFYRRFSIFFFGLDSCKDVKLNEYMYETPYFPDIEKNYERMAYLCKVEEEEGKLTTEQSIEKENLIISAMYQMQLLEVEDDYRQYLIDDLKVPDYGHIEQKTKIRKIIFLILALISYLYTKIYSTMLISIQDTIISLHISSFILILIFFQVFCLYTVLKKKRFIIPFWCLSYSICISTFIIFLNHNVPLMFNDVPIDYFGITVSDYYTINEKIMFLQEYMKHILANTNLSINQQQYILTIVHNIPFETLIYDTTSISTIREFVNSFVLHIIRLEYYYTLIDPALPQVNNLPEIIKFLRNSIIIFSVTTTLVKINYFIVIVYKTYNVFPEVCFTIIKTFLKYYK